MRRADGPKPNEYSSDVLSTQVPSLGKTNDLSLRLPVKGEWRDIFTTPAREINSHDFKEMTLEGAFKCESAGTFGGFSLRMVSPTLLRPTLRYRLLLPGRMLTPKNWEST